MPARAEATQPAALKADAEVLDDAAQILRARFRTGKYEIVLLGLGRAETELVSRSRHPSRMHLRGGANYKPPPAPEGTEQLPDPEALGAVLGFRPLTPPEDTP